MTVATEKQIAANRTNAKRSTGPKTATGKSRSSRNSFRHGLSLQMPPDAVTEQRLVAMVQALVSGGSAREHQLAFAEAAQAQLDLLRIRKVRADMMVELSAPIGDSQYLRRLLALDRYERRALTRRRRAGNKL